jgi:hypothetical protein
MSFTSPQPKPRNGTHFAADASRIPASKSSFDNITQENTETQLEARIEGQSDLERPRLVNDLEVSPTGHDLEDGNDLKLPVLKSSLVDRAGDDGTANRDRIERGSKELPIEIPDSDAISPFSSPQKEITAQVGMGSFGDVEEVVKDVEDIETVTQDEEVREPAAALEGGKEKVKDMMVSEEDPEEGVVSASSGTEGEAAMVPQFEVVEVPTSAELVQDVGIKGGQCNDGTPLPNEESPHLQSPPSDNQNVLQAADALSTEQALALQRSILGDEDLATEEASLATIYPHEEHGRGPASAITERESKESVNSPIEESVLLASPLYDMNVVITEDVLPIAKASFLGKAIRADEALSVKGNSASKDITASKQLSPTTEDLPKEIPPSDVEEDAMDEDTDPLANVFEFHTTHGPSSEDPDTFFMNVQITKQSDQPVPLSSSTTEVETPVLEDASSWEVEGVDLIDAPSLSADAAETIGNTAPVQDPNITKQTLSADTMDIKTAELSPSKDGSEPAKILSPVANLDGTSGTTQGGFSEARDVDVIGVAAQMQDDPDPIEQPASQFCMLDSNPITTVPPSCAKLSKIGLALTSSNDEEFAEILPFSKVGNEYPTHLASSPQETQRLARPSSQTEEDGDPVDQITSSPPRLKECSVAPVKPIVTPNAFFAAPKESQNKKRADGAPTKVTSSASLSFTTPIGSQSKAGGLSTPKKAAGASSVSPKAADGSPDKDVLFDELKAMKIVRPILCS